MMILGILAFSMGLAVSLYAILSTVVPDLARIGDALMGREQYMTPLESLALTERRIAIRRRMPASAPVPAVRVRAAA